METILKKYFWVVNLVVIGICAGFAGRAAGHFVEGAYLAGDTVKSPVRHTPPPPPPKVHPKDGELIIGRNVFCSGCAPIKTDTSTNDTSPDTGPQKTSLQLELVSTMVCPDDDNWSMAIIRELATQQKDPGMFNKGMTIGVSGAEVIKVLSKRVYIKNGGRTEYVELDGAAPVPPPSAAPPSPPMAAGDANMGDIPDSSVRCSGNNCTVERALVEKLLANTAMLATSARFVPSIKDGKPNGFKLYAIRPQSIFGRIGLQNGDTIKQINGSDMTTADAALSLYTKLRNASHLSVQVERRGETVALDYTIR
jgi:type II secretion system protein C